MISAPSGTTAITSGQLQSIARRRPRSRQYERSLRPCLARFSRAGRGAAAPERALRPPHEVDRDRYALEAELVAQPVLDPVPVVARDEARVVDDEPEARRARLDLSAVQEVEALRPA